MQSCRNFAWVHWVSACCDLIFWILTVCCVTRCGPLILTYGAFVCAPCLRLPYFVTTSLELGVPVGVSYLHSYCVVDVDGC